jgi:ADP-heptose:LPS heptosyltransferase
MASRFTKWWKEWRRVRAIRRAQVASSSQHLVAAERTLPARPRILILKLDHIGDFVLAMRALLQIRDGWPNAHITLVCGGWNVEMAKRLGMFDAIVAYDFFPQNRNDAQPAACGPNSRLAARGLGGPFDLAIDMRYDGDTRPLLEAIDATFRAGYAARGLKKELDLALPTLESSGRRRQPMSPLHAELRLFLLAAAVVDVFGPRQTHPIRSIANGKDPRADPHDHPYIVVAAGAGKTTCKWPIANFVALCSALAEKRMEAIVVIGSSRDADDGRAIAEALPPGRVRDTTGQIPIGELPGVLSKARLYVGNDSGPTHIAAKIGIPTICIFSGTSDDRVWQPLGANVRTIRRPIECSPCHLDREEDCPVAVKCLKLITVDDVLDDALAMLAESDASK